MKGQDVGYLELKNQSEAKVTSSLQIPVHIAVMHLLRILQT